MSEKIIDLGKKRQSSSSYPFYVDGDGVWYVPSDGNGKIRICSQLIVAAVTRDEESLNHGKLLVFEDSFGVEHKWAMPMEMLAGDGLEYRKILMSMGLEIGSSKKEREQLSMYIQATRPDVSALCVSKTGWCQDVYVLPDGLIGDSTDELHFQSPWGPVKGFSLKCSVADWRENVASLCQGNSRLVFAVCCAFAAALIGPFEEESGGFNFFGRSSTGKTTALKVANSVWGSPDRLRRWRATDNGLEALATIHNDSLLCLDELGQLNPKFAGAVAYMLANGMGKQRSFRSGAARPTATWKLYFLSAGETELADMIRQSGQMVRAGQLVRVVDIPADAGAGLGMFEELHGFSSGAELSRNLCAVSRDYYGSPSREFLSQFAKGKTKYLEFIDQKRRIFLERFATADSDGQVTRVAHKFALIAAAGELATKMGLSGWSVNEAMSQTGRCFLDWVDARGGLNARESEQALKQVRRFIEAHGESRFSPWEPHGDFHPRTINRAGFRREFYGNNESDTFFYVFTETFKDEVCKGLDWRYVATLLLEKGLLVTDKDRKTKNIRRPDTGKTTRFYVLKNILEDVEEVELEPSENNIEETLTKPEPDTDMESKTVRREDFAEKVKLVFGE